MYNNCNILYILLKDITNNCDVSIFLHCIIILLVWRMSFRSWKKVDWLIFFFFPQELRRGLTCRRTRATGSFTLTTTRRCCARPPSRSSWWATRCWRRSSATWRPSRWVRRIDPTARPPRPHLHHLSADWYFVGRLLRSWGTFRKNITRAEPRRRRAEESRRTVIGGKEGGRRRRGRSPDFGLLHFNVNVNSCVNRAARWTLVCKHEIKGTE